MHFLAGFALGVLAGGVGAYLYAQKAIAKLQAAAGAVAADTKKL